MRSTLLSSVLVLCAIAVYAQAVTRYVPSTYPTIQAAIDDCNDGDTVIVADGNYIGDGNRNIDFYGKIITVKSENGPENCIIDCQNLGRGFYFHNGEDANCVLEGFTTTNGNASSGGGISCEQTAPTIRNCIISNNSADYDGGGIYCYESNPTITNCTITDNSAYVESFGGGLYCLNGNPTVANCTITGNWAEMGGGIWYNNSNPIITTCTISGNSAFVAGGIACYSGGNISNCTITGNGATSWGGGVFCSFYSNPTITNCTISGNSAGSGGGIWNGDGSSTALTSCILWGDTATEGNEIFLNQEYNSSITVSYSNVEGGSAAVYIGTGSTLNWLGGNIDADPCFVDPNNSNFHLKSQTGRWDPNIESWVQDEVTSPCIDAGDPNSPIGLEPFPNGGRINMGVYGGTVEASKSYFGGPVCETIVAGDINGDCIVDFKDFAIMTRHWLVDNTK